MKRIGEILFSLLLILLAICSIFSGYAYDKESEFRKIDEEMELENLE